MVFISGGLRNFTENSCCPRSVETLCSTDASAAACVLCLGGGYKQTGEIDRQTGRQTERERKRSETGTSHSMVRTGSCGREQSFHVFIVSYRSFWSDDFCEVTFQPAIRTNSGARRDVTATVIC